MKIHLRGRLRPGVYAKDLALWIIGQVGADGANYLSVEYHGAGVATLSLADRLTLANLASEMGAKNAVFPADAVLTRFLGDRASPGVWGIPAPIRKELEVISAGLSVVAAPMRWRTSGQWPKWAGVRIARRSSHLHERPPGGPAVAAQVLEGNGSTGSAN
jgi:hypothetical protein